MSKTNKMIIEQVAKHGMAIVKDFRGNDKRVIYGPMADRESNRFVVVVIPE